MAYKSVMSSPKMAMPVVRLLIAGLWLIAVMVATLTLHPLFAQSQDGTIMYLYPGEHPPRQGR